MCKKNCTAIVQKSSG